MPINQKPGLKLVVVAPPGATDADVEAIAHVAAVRARGNESAIKVAVIPATGGEAKETTVPFKD
jgi:hypothetical protein